jgi:hypothetical protein
MTEKTGQHTPNGHSFACYYHNPLPKDSERCQNCGERYDELSSWQKCETPAPESPKKDVSRAVELAQKLHSLVEKIPYTIEAPEWVLDDLHDALKAVKRKLADKLLKELIEELEK